MVYGGFALVISSFLKIMLTTLKIGSLSSLIRCFFGDIDVTHRYPQRPRQSWACECHTHCVYHIFFALRTSTRQYDQVESAASVGMQCDSTPHPKALRSRARSFQLARPFDRRFPLDRRRISHLRDSAGVLSRTDATSSSRYHT